MVHYWYRSCLAAVKQDDVNGAMDEWVDLDAYVAQLRWLLRWDPRGDPKTEEKSAFIDGLTEIAALPSDTLSMEVRRLLVEPTGADGNVALDHMIHALSCRDVLLKCKAANAIGTICMSRVAGQRLLDAHPEELLASLIKMATCKNQWAQGDAFFVLGWLVVFAEEEVVAKIARLLPSVVKLLLRNLNAWTANTSLPSEESHDQESSNSAHSLPTSTEQASNLRIYSLVLLLNFCQKDVNAITTILPGTLETVQLVVAKLLAQTEALHKENDTTDSADALEYAELLRLAVTLLSLLVELLPAATPIVLERRMLPQLLKLKHVIDNQHIDGVGEEELRDLQDRMHALVDTIVTFR